MFDVAQYRQEANLNFPGSVVLYQTARAVWAIEDGAEALKGLNVRYHTHRILDPQAQVTKLIEVVLIDESLLREAVRQLTERGHAVTVIRQVVEQHAPLDQEEFSLTSNRKLYRLAVALTMPNLLSMARYALQSDTDLEESERDAVLKYVARAVLQEDSDKTELANYLRLLRFAESAQGNRDALGFMS